jgi:phosphatidylserine/phosphatidylglycerophosphate/cardiolipin synthase-like enzyme
VRVRIVCTGDGDVCRLRAGGVQVVADKALYIHAKAIVADGATVFIGSENISSTSLDKNREMGLILTDHAVVATVE